ncbi:N-methyl-L-tryptophan oxidase [Caulobacter sp. NIBR1757]|uniref:N-methyl-L-tryptophan oxidase n=1 Tax=Caulobacter sp. NIBR1757 TaxID=3016000 RepID=UPI0022F12E3E|nr:N-methyl-L-tryptophan oxidase [Caulobacter sp. NIBR1757]WGM37705.1 Monomeric sarcosine oxidase [Caulobacter sp. NIBR1757]
MRRCEVAVIGLGLMGAAALDALLRAGVDAVGFDPLEPGSSRGSSHGSCRVFRRFNFENPHYTALSDEALYGWDRLAVESGRQLLIPCPILEAGPPGSETVRQSRQAALDHGRDTPLLSGAQVNARFPAFALPDDWDAVVQDGGAILLTQVALEALRARGRAEGRIRTVAVTGLEPGGDHVLVRTAEDSWRAERVILAAGPWMDRFLPALAPVLTVTRQSVGWFAPTRPKSTALGAFPIFIIERGRDDTVYGFPDFEGRGVKAAPHNHGPVVDADAWEPPASDAELAQVSRFLTELIPGAAGPITERDVCLYTNTRPSAEDAGEEFIIDRWPGSRLVVGSACSGHGAKFAPAIGERLARLATDPGFEIEPFFRLSRYPAFA